MTKSNRISLAMPMIFMWILDLFITDSIVPTCILEPIGITILIYALFIKKDELS